MFHYSRGVVKTTIPFNQPTWENAINYFNYIKHNSDILDKYNLYIRGAFLYDIENTWDLDINMTGNYQQVNELEKDLNYLLDISLNHFKFLIDTKWVQELFPVYTYENAINTEHKISPLPNIQVTNTYITINGVTKKLDKTNTIILEQLSENLILIEAHYKHKDKFFDLVMKNPNRVVAQSIEVKEFMQMSQAEFFQNTNNYK